MRYRISHGNQIFSRAMVMQQKTHRPVQFELTEQTRDAVASWITKAELVQNNTFFQVDRKNLRTSRRGNMRELCIDGFSPSVWMARNMEHTLCDEQRQL
jgi:hypothetical protein